MTCASLVVDYRRIERLVEHHVLQTPAQIVNVLHVAERIHAVKVPWTGAAPARHEPTLLQTNGDVPAFEVSKEVLEVGVGKTQRVGVELEYLDMAGGR